MVNVNVGVDCIHIKDKIQGTLLDIIRKIDGQTQDRPAVREEKDKITKEVIYTKEKKAINRLLKLTYLQMIYFRDRTFCE